MLTSLLRLGSLEKRSGNGERERVGRGRQHLDIGITWKPDEGRPRQESGLIDSADYSRGEPIMEGLRLGSGW